MATIQYNDSFENKDNNSNKSVKLRTAMRKNRNRGTTTATLEHDMAAV